jgi:hypothetical protein
MEIVLVHRSDTSPPPPPRTAPCCPGEIDRHQAVDIAMAEATRHSCSRLAVHEVKRKKRYWQVELRGRGAHGHRVEVRVRIDRSSGEVLSYRTEHDEGRHRGHDS